MSKIYTQKLRELVSTQIYLETHKIPLNLVFFIPLNFHLCISLLNFSFNDATFQLLFSMNHLLWVKTAFLKGKLYSQSWGYFLTDFTFLFFLTIVLPKAPYTFNSLKSDELEQFSLSSLQCLRKESHSICFQALKEPKYENLEFDIIHWASFPQVQ